MRERDTRAALLIEVTRTCLHAENAWTLWRLSAIQLPWAVPTLRLKSNTVRLLTWAAKSRSDGRAHPRLDHIHCRGQGNEHAGDTETGVEVDAGLQSIGFDRMAPQRQRPPGSRMSNRLHNTAGNRSDSRRTTQYTSLPNTDSTQPRVHRWAHGINGSMRWTGPIGTDNT